MQLNQFVFLKSFDLTNEYCFTYQDILIHYKIMNLRKLASECPQNSVVSLTMPQLYISNSLNTFNLSYKKSGLGLL